MFSVLAAMTLLAEGRDTMMGTKILGAAAVTGALYSA
jgi:hypothetical protein